MAIYKNTASQKLAVFAYDKTTGAAKTGDAANITAYLSKDWGAAAAVADTNPTEMDATNMAGWYAFDLTQAESNAEVLVLAPKSSTANVVIDQVQVFTDSLSAARAGYLDNLNGHVAQTGDAYARIGANGAGLTALPWNAAWDAEVQSEAADALTAYDAATGTDVANLHDFNPASEAVTLAAGTHTGAVVPTVTAVTNDVGITQAGADKVWGSSSRTLSAFGFGVTVATNNDKVGYSLSAAGVQAIWDALTSALTAAGSIGKLVVDKLGAALDAAGVRGALGLAAANLDAQLGDLPTNAELAGALADADDATLAAIGALNNLSSADAQAAATAALEAEHLHRLIKDPVLNDWATTVTQNSVIGLLASKSGPNTFDRTTDSLEALRDRGDAAWTTATGFSTLTAQQVWEYVTRELTSAGAGGATAQEVWEYATRALTDKAGFALTGAYDAAKTAATQTSVDDLPTNAELATALAGADDAVLSAIAALNNLSSAGAQAAAAAALAAYDAATGTDVTAATSGLSTLTAQQVWEYVTRTLTAGGGVTAQQVWEYATRTLTASGDPTAAAIADAVWDEALSGHAGAGSAGAALSGAGNAGDPWGAVLPGAYPVGTAGYLLDYIRSQLLTTAADIASAVGAGNLSIQRGDTWTANLAGLGSLAGRSKLWVTLKTNPAHADADAVIQVEEGAGLLYLNGAEATASDGSLLVTDAADGDITLTVKASATAGLAPTAVNRLWYDVQMLTGTTVRTLAVGRATVVADVTRAIA